MLQVAPLKREIIDLWPVAESGLPVRVVNSVGAAGVMEIGQLRTWSDQKLLGLRSLGRISLGHVRSFFKLCGQIEQGKQSFQTIQEVFGIFLDSDELKVLAARYGFDREDFRASRSVTTLQEIGDEENKTRERIRQIEETAKRNLRSRLATVCLEPFYERFVSFLDSRGRVASCTDLASLHDDPLLAGRNICSILLLLSDLRPDRITFYHGFFSTLPESVLAGTESEVLAILDREARPVPLDDLLKALPPFPADPSPGQMKQVVACVMDHCPAAASTVDGRYFLFARGVQAFLIELMKNLERPVHYRTVTQNFNQRLKPLSRKGAGFILEMLNANPQCTRVDRGIYDLKAE